MKEKIIKIFIILILIVVVSYFGYQFLKKDTSKENTEAEQEESEREIAIKELVDRYSALTDWDEGAYYTIQLQDSMVESEKPILFMGYIDDVFREDEQYFIRFRTDFLTSPEIIFVLQVDYNKISGILYGQGSEGEGLFGFLNNYAVVAEIDKINKLNLQIIGYPEGAEEVALENAPADIHVATGKCIDFTYVGSIFDIE